MQEILDRTKTYLKLFGENGDVTIDHSLPKWIEIDQYKKKEREEDVKKSGPSNINPGTETKLLDSEYTKLIAHKKSKKVEINEDMFKDMSASDLNIFLNKDGMERFRKAMGYAENYYNLGNYVSVDMDDTALGFPPSDQSPIHTKNGNVLRSVITRLKASLSSSDDKEDKHLYRFDIVDFFREVKLATKEEDKEYQERITPYLIAIKNAQRLGQQTLIDKLLAEIFVTKYESLLRASGYKRKITEKQLVNFVLQSRKGLRLSYIQNFSHPIPDGVADKKVKADELKIFDNYVVLYYDPDGTVYAPTQRQQEQERKRKVDPILFGVLNGCHNLYYIADWVDKYCDLTLAEFIKKSGLSEVGTSISEKVEI